MTGQPKPPTYDLSIAAKLYLSARIFTGQPRRSCAQDAAWLLTMHTPTPAMSGLEHIPKTGGFMVIGNHYQRPGMWIGWAGGLVTDAVNRVRPGYAPVRVVVTDSQRMRLFGRERTLPLSRWFLGRIAHAWHMIPIPADRADTSGHAIALRATLRALGDGDGVLFFPEGEGGTASSLIDALPGTGTLIALASRRAVLIPCGFREEGALLHGQFGPPITLDSRDDHAVHTQVMRAVAALLPPALRGAYGE